MSSLSRGATGTIKPKSVNVNNIFAGRNIAPGQRASSRYGMQSVGKSSGAVRRMPPPAHLPSLKAENNGQDPTTPVVPQGGTGWSKGDGPAPPNEVQPSPPSQPPVVNDLRPSWLVTPSEQAANNSAREFPSLAPPSDDEGKPINKWENSTLSQKLVEMSAEEYCDRVPSRFLDSSNTPPAPKPPAKTKYNKNMDSQDVRYRHPELVQLRKYFEPNLITCDDEGFDSQDRDRTYSTEESGMSPNCSPKQVEVTVPQKIEEREDRNYRRHNDERKAAACRANEIRILKRTEQLLLQDISDDEDEVQMTRLDKPNTGVIKRRGVSDTSANETKPTTIETNGETTITNGKEKTGKHEKNSSKEKKSSKKESKTADGEHQSEASEHKKHHKISIQQMVPLAHDEESSPPPEKEEDVLPAPPPQENIWAKRQEERESQEREKEKSAIPRVMQQAIAHHFPLVTEAATIKVDKESTRQASDTEFTRAAIRARKPPTSNDVRRIHHGHNDARYHDYRQNENNEDREYYESGPGYENGGSNRRGARNGPNSGRHNNVRGARNDHQQNTDEQLDTESQERGRRDSYRSNYSHESGRNGASGQRNGAPAARGGARGGRAQNGSKNIPTDRKKFDGEGNKGPGQENKQNMKNRDIRKMKQHEGEEIENKQEEKTIVPDENEDNEGFEEVHSKKAKSKKEKETTAAKSNNLPRSKQPKNANRLFVPKALRKESDDLPANGLLSTQSGDTKERSNSKVEKINGDSSRNSANEEEAETDRGFNAIVNEISDLVGVEESQPVKAEEQTKDIQADEEGLLEFSDSCKIAKTAETEYDFSFDPHLHSISQLTTEKATLQQMLSAVSGASSDDATLKEKMNRIKDLWTVVSAEGERSNVAMVKPQPQVGDLVIMEGAIKGGDAFNVQSLRSNNSAPISLAPFSGHYSVFQPLYQNTENSRLAATAASPPNNYLSMSPYSGVSTQQNYSFENGSSNRTSGNVNQQHNIWNNGHLDISALAGTPPPAVLPNSNGNYAFFGSGQQKNGQNGFGGVGNSSTSSLGLGNSQQQYYDRPSLPPANLAVGSQRQSNMYNSNSGSQNSNNRMNGMGNIPTSNGSFPNFFNQPPPPVNQPSHNLRYPNNGPNSQSHNNESNPNAYFFNGGNRTDNRGMNSHSSGQSDMNWPNSNYFNNPPPHNHQQNGGWNNGQNPNGPRQFQQNQFRDQQQQMNRVRRPFAGQSQGSRQ